MIATWLSVDQSGARPVHCRSKRCAPCRTDALLSSRATSLRALSISPSGKSSCGIAVRFRWLRTDAWRALGIAGAGTSDSHGGRLIQQRPGNVRALLQQQSRAVPYCSRPVTGDVINRLRCMNEGTADPDVEPERRLNETMSRLPIVRSHLLYRPQTIALADHVVELGRERPVDAPIPTAVGPAGMWQPGLRLGIMLKVAP